MISIDGLDSIHRTCKYTEAIYIFNHTTPEASYTHTTVYVYVILHVCVTLFVSYPDRLPYSLYLVPHNCLINVPSYPPLES